MREYELYIPLNDNEGRPIDADKLKRLKRRLVLEFGGLTYFPQENEGVWKVGAFTFRDKVVILRVLSNDVEKAKAFFAALKADIRREWEQADVLIVCREVGTV
jgi:hypothetical protein